MEERLKLSFLFDFYGALLTDKQRQCFEMYLFQDLSFAEIAEEMGISRQAVYDMVHRSRQTLEEYEGKLCLVSRYKNITKALNDVFTQVASLETSDNSEQIAAVLKKIEPFLDNREV